MHWDQFFQFSKTCHLSRIRCFLKLLFVKTTLICFKIFFFFTFFLEFQLLTKLDYFANAIAYAL